MDSGYLALVGVAALAVTGFLLWLRGMKRGLATGEAKERAREAIAEIRESVKRGDDADIQRRIAEKLNER